MLIVLVVSVVLAIVVVGLATYSAGTLRYGRTVEDAADRLATAQGAMDNALEAIDRNSSPCTLTALAGTAGGYTYGLGDQINSITPSITCETVGGDVNAVDAFAVIITGDGAGRTGPLLTITNGGNSAQAEKIFEGPVYMADSPRSTGAATDTMDFNATLTIKEGDLWYSSATGLCPASDVSPPTQLTITPAGYTTKCLEETWVDLFQSRRPPEPDVANTGQFPARSSVTPTPDSLGCYVWPAGAYTSPPDLANNSYNYFEDGDYYFDFASPDTAWSINNAFVLMGNVSGPGIAGPGSHDTFSNNPCRDAWASDTDVSTETNAGAAVYLGGASSIEIDQNGTFEISGRDHSGYDVGVQALEVAGTPSTVRGDSRIVYTGSGSNKQLSINGLVWAPYAAFEFDLIANDAVAALTGGAVVGELSAGASANANNFVIQVDTQPATVNMELTTTAVNTGSTSVKTVLNYRTDSEYEILSRRIVNLTTE